MITVTALAVLFGIPNERPRHWAISLGRPGVSFFLRRRRSFRGKFAEKVQRGKKRREEEKGEKKEMKGRVLFRVRSERRRSIT